MRLLTMAWSVLCCEVQHPLFLSLVRNSKQKRFKSQRKVLPERATSPTQGTSSRAAQSASRRASVSSGITSDSDSAGSSERLQRSRPSLLTNESASSGENGGQELATLQVPGAAETRDLDCHIAYHSQAKRRDK